MSRTLFVALCLWASAASASAQSECGPRDVRRWQEIIDVAAEFYQLPVPLLWAVVLTESHGKVTALIDWENARVGDPREDLGWMMMMDDLSNTKIMNHPADEGGFLAYYNKLTGYEITEQEVGYFVLFGTANIAVPVNAERVTEGHRGAPATDLASGNGPREGLDAVRPVEAVTLQVQPVGPCHQAFVDV